MSSIKQIDNIIKYSINPHFLLDENTMSLFEYTHSEHETQAEPFVEISGIAFLFSGHLAPTLPIISFICS
jgi:hypothetical protein